MLPDLYDLLDLFALMTGLHVDWGKSCIFPLREAEQAEMREPEPRQLSWFPRTFHYLGIRIYHMDKDLLDGNHKRSALRQSMGFWTKLLLSPMGRASITKMLLLPRHLYIFPTLPIIAPRTFFGELRH